ncbi:MAG TPA: hypothetical protein EYP14_04615 [Planctomycetaceae bacterium]|nr:hypothetical protein [Planctomycetaceae bacterium]
MKTTRALTIRSMLPIALATLAMLTSPAWGQIVVPGTGERIAWDDFEDENWEFTHNFPKSSRNIDGREREPFGISNNNLWIESAKRGQPDVILRVPTPPGGLPGSKGAMLMRTLYSGIPNTTSLKFQQDDLIMRLSSQVGAIPTSWYPSVVVRVYLPPFDEWENRTGASFGFRADVVGTKWEQPKRRGIFFIRRRKMVSHTYWPGMFIQFNSKTDPQYDEDSAVFIIRGDDSGRDFLGPYITQTGWWTLGMSFTPDGRVHYFASPGVDRLTMKDHIASHAPYYSKCKTFNTIFFNVCSANDGEHYSTTWIVDDPELYVIRR